MGFWDQLLDSGIPSFGGGAEVIVDALSTLGSCFRYVAFGGGLAVWSEHGLCPQTMTRHVVAVQGGAVSLDVWVCRRFGLDF